MAARITISIKDGNFFEIYLNEEGRDLLVRELLDLNDKNDHLHLAPKGHGGGIELRSRPYDEADHVLDWGKILLRLDKWDEQHYPHTLD